MIRVKKVVGEGCINGVDFVGDDDFDLDTVPNGTVLTAPCGATAAKVGEIMAPALCGCCEEIGWTVWDVTPAP